MIHILIILGLGWSAGSATAEFNSKDACEVAVTAVKATAPLQTAFCVPKGPALASGKE